MLDTQLRLCDLAKWYSTFPQKPVAECYQVSVIYRDLVLHKVLVLLSGYSQMIIIFQWDFQTHPWLTHWGEDNITDIFLK